MLACHASTNETTQIVCNESADIIGSEDFFSGPRRLLVGIAHDWPPFAGVCHPTMKFAPQWGADKKSYGCCNGATAFAARVS
jgi:hypothetical protein